MSQLLGLLSINDEEFKSFQQLIYKAAGIHLPPTKKMLVVSRLGKRVRHYSLNNFQDYYQLVLDHQHTDEFQIMVDLLTTNETYFFREADHFTYLKQHLLPHYPREHPFQAWSAACSSGEEAYTTAMILMDIYGTASTWSILATDISSRMLHLARNGVYPLSASKHIPKNYLTQYCLKGVRSQAGTFCIDKRLRERVKFQQLNLNAPNYPHLPLFDLIILRNVLIYFDLPTKRKLLQKIIQQLQPGGYLFIGHAENLSSLTSPEIQEQLNNVAPTIYRKKAAAK